MGLIILFAACLTAFVYGYMLVFWFVGKHPQEFQLFLLAFIVAEVLVYDGSAIVRQFVFWSSSAFLLGCFLAGMWRWRGEQILAFLVRKLKL